MAEMNNEHHCTFVRAGTRSGLRFIRIEFHLQLENPQQTLLGWALTNDSKTLLAQFPKARSIHCEFPIDK